jgi:hypothetical protein
MIDYDHDILKHYVRTQGWLPACRRRLKRLREGRSLKQQRRLKYFTFCAVRAIDVLMLDVARVVRPSADGGFDTVCFFDRSREAVIETQKRIPGAIGFPGEFIAIVLSDDPDEATVADGAEGEVLIAPEQEPDRRETRERQVQLDQRRAFIRKFPFDVVNLDLEAFLFKSSQEMPGRVISALRKVLEWQRRPVTGPKSPAEHLREFTLMFTTQVGPPNMGNNYLEMLARRIDENLARDGELRAALLERTGATDGNTLRGSNFEAFFEFAVPKVLMHLLLENDWHVDPKFGLRIFEFERQSKDGPYKMLHFVMDVLRNNPPRENRAPGDPCVAAIDAYRQVAKDVFRREPVRIVLEDIDVAALRPTLEQIASRRRKYCPE